MVVESIIKGITDPLTSLSQDFLPKKVDTYAKQKAECAARGGTWDDAKKICILQEKTNSSTNSSSQMQGAQAVEKVNLTRPEATKNESGNYTISLPNGQTLVGISKGDAEGILSNWEGKQIQGEYSPVGTAQRQAQGMQNRQQVLQELGQLTGVSQAELNQLVEKYNLTSMGQLKEGLPGVLRDAAPGALQSGLTAGVGLAVAGGMTGGKLGAVGGPWGIAAGAAAGVVFGLARGVLAAQKSEAAEDVKNAKNEFTQLRTGISQLATMSSTGLINEYEAVELYNAYKSRMLQIEAQIKYLQDTNLKDYLSDGSDDLAEIQSYLNNVAPVYEMRIRSNLVNPTAKVPYSEVILQDMQELEND